MADQVSVSEFSQDPKQDTGSAASDDDKNPSAKLRLAGARRRSWTSPWDSWRS